MPDHLTALIRAAGRVLVVSNRWPPAGSGTPIILYELFRHFPADSCTVVCGPGLRPPSDMRLPFHTRRLTLPGADRIASGLYRKAGAAVLEPLRRYLRWVARRERPRVIYAHYPDAVFVTAAALVAEELGIPLVVYFDILWEGNDEPGLAAKYARRVAHVAQRRFAITEAYCEHLSEKYGVPFELLPHTIVPPSEGLDAASRAERVHAIHFSGAVYPAMNLDAVQRLHRVLARMAGPPELEILGFNKPGDLARWGLSTARTGRVTRSELFALQRKRAILYLPEAFESSVPDMIRYNFPTKALEYMLTGAPILVHAPGWSYLARSAREHGWGLVVDEPSDDKLRDGVSRLLEDGAFAQQLAQRAWEFAKSRDARTWSKMLQDALGVSTAETKGND